MSRISAGTPCSACKITAFRSLPWFLCFSIFQWSWGERTFWKCCQAIAPDTGGLENTTCWPHHKGELHTIKKQVCICNDLGSTNSEKAGSILCKRQPTTLQSVSRQRTGRTGTVFFLPWSYRIHLHQRWNCSMILREWSLWMSTVYRAFDCRGYWAVSLTLWIGGSHLFVHSHGCFLP